MSGSIYPPNAHYRVPNVDVGARIHLVPKLVVVVGTCWQATRNEKSNLTVLWGFGESLNLRYCSVGEP